MFGFQAPGSLGGATGIAALAPGFAYSDNFELDLAVINWTQGFANGKAGYAVGRLAFDVYLDAFPFQTFSRGFLNRSFILNPTFPTTGVGAIGGVSKGSGWGVSTAWKLNDTYFPFIRFGHSDGGGGVAAEDAVSGGVEISRPRRETWTIGAG